MGNLKDVFGEMYRGYLGGFGEGAGLPSIAGRYTRADVSGTWAEVGRQLGQLHGYQFSSTPTGLTAKSIEAFRDTPTYRLLMQLAQRLRQHQKPTPPPGTASDVRQRQGEGMWMGDIGEE